MNEPRITLRPVLGCDCTEPHPSYYKNRGALSAEATAKATGRMLCARDFGCSRLHDVVLWDTEKAIYGDERG